MGFSQEYDDPKKGGLLQDANHWLERSKGRVKCVLLVCIDDGKKPEGTLAGEEVDQMADARDTDTPEGSTQSLTPPLRSMNANISDSL